VSELAAEAAQAWYDAAELFRRASTAYRPLRTQLKQLVSEAGEMGIAFQEGDPVVVLLHAERLTVARPTEPSSEHSPIEFESIGLATPARVCLTAGEAQMAEGFFRTRIWALGDPAAAPLVLETRSRTSRALPEENAGEELVARAAIALGWPGREA
jgi:hypothetical protein